MRRWTITLLLCLTLTATAAGAQEFVIVTHPDLPLATLSQRDVKNIYLGKLSTWRDGSPVKPFMLAAPHPSHAFIREITQMTPQQFYLFWRRNIFTGQGIPPVELSSVEQMKNVIASRPGGIGYLPPEAVDGTVKVLDLQP